MKTITITETDAGQRLDKFLKKYFRDASSGFLYKMLRKKNIVLNSAKADGSERLFAGDEIDVYFSDETFDAFRGATAQDEAFFRLSTLPHPHVAVIFEDEDILIVNKPAGILSQKRKENDISINEEILSYLIENGTLTPETYRTFHPSVGNRLDRNTSGLLLFGKTLQGQQTIATWMRDRTARKFYRCIVKGEIAEEIHLQGYLTKDEAINRVTVSETKEESAVSENMPADRTRKKATSPAGVSAEPNGEKNQYIETRFSPLRTIEVPLNGTIKESAATVILTELEAELITGRTHQIRAHLSSVNHPIIFDEKYGDRTLNQRLRNQYYAETTVPQLLHAYRIELPDGREFIAPLPERFAVFEAK